MGRGHMQTLHKIGKSFWYMTPESTTDRPILGMVVGTQKTLMIDAGNSEAHAAYENVVARALTEDERETIADFVNGYAI